MSNQELRAKFDSLAVPVVGAGRAAQIAELANEIERCGDIGKLMRLTAAARRAARGKISLNAR